jgi:hypothetical protein
MVIKDNDDGTGVKITRAEITRRKRQPPRLLFVTQRGRQAAQKAERGNTNADERFPGDKRVYVRIHLNTAHL